MIFSEIYGAYYHTVAAILSEAITQALSEDQLRNIVTEYAFSESIVSIPAALKEGRWQLLNADGTTPIKHKPSMPLSHLQKQWLKAVSCDPRIRLFGDMDLGLDDIKPLFLPSDVILFDKYSDGDDYSDEGYIARFRLILDAIRNKYPLHIRTLNRKGDPLDLTVLPERLEYSEKDDKFRLIGFGQQSMSTINLGRILSCEPSEKSFSITHEDSDHARPRMVTFELTDQRKALERVLLHFAHFEKTAEKISDDKYLITVHYDKEDEIELVIRILSFGPMIRVTAPQHFIDLIKQRLKDQKSCEQ